MGPEAPGSGGGGGHENESLFRTYSRSVDQVNMGIGVNYQLGQSTDLDKP